MKTNSTSNLPKARISRLSRKDIESYQEALGNDAYSKELVAEFAVAHVKAHALQTEIYRRIASGNKRKDSGKTLSPNAERARIIAKAEEFVEELMSGLLPGNRLSLSNIRISVGLSLGGQYLRHSSELKAQQHTQTTYITHISERLSQSDACSTKTLVSSKMPRSL